MRLQACPVVAWIFLLALLPVTLAAQSARTLLDEGTRLMELYQEEAALDLFVKALKLEPSSYEAMWKCSLMKSHVGNRIADPVAKANHLSSAKYLAEKAIQANPQHAEGYFSLCTAQALIALESSTKEKVAASKMIHDNALKALQYDPSHAGAWHVLGGWHFNVANLNFAERAAAKLIFGAELEGASVEKALECYNNALKGKPRFIRYLYDKAECLYHMGKKDESVKLLNTTLATPVLSLDDPPILEKARQLLSRIR